MAETGGRRMTDNEICIVEVYYYEVIGKLLKCEDCPFGKGIGD